MSNFMELRETLTKSLLTIKGSTYTSGKSEILFRCPYCGDSKKHSTSKHFYVKIPHVEGDLPVYYCHLCNTKGVLSSKTLNAWLDERFDAPQLLNSYVKKASKLAKNRQYANTKVYRLQVPIPNMNDPYTFKKIEYLNNRLGINLTVEDILRFKIIVNLYDLLNLNKVDKLSGSKNYTDLIDEDCIGFLSRDNAYVNFRNTGNRINKRYVMYNIFGVWDNSRAFYIMRSDVDIMNGPVNIHITEGGITLMGVYHHITKQSPGIYAASIGTGFEGTIRYFLKNGLFDAVFHIYPDMDKGMDERSYFEKLKKNIGEYRFLYPIKIIQNHYPGEKDFGITPDKMKPNYYEI